jgi:hypothetical protein
MTRFRAKLVGFGLAALAGSAAAGEDWQPPTPGPPQYLPAGAVPAPDPIWLPAARREPPTVIPAQHPTAPPAIPAAPPVITPPVIEIPPVARVPVPAAQPAQPAPPRIPPAADGPWRAPGHDPIPAPRPVEPPKLQPSDAPPKKMPEPVPPPDFLPAPRPWDAGPAPARQVPAPVADPRDPRPFYGATQVPTGELPVAPPELLVPAGAVAPGKHGTFGSPPIRLSRDYPSLGELCGSLAHLGAGPAAGVVGFTNGYEGLPQRGFVSAEYLLWWVPGLDIPILATTNPDPNRFGFIGEPGTRSILGPGELLGGTRNGVRARAGYWFGDGLWAFDGGVFALGRRTAEVVLSPDQFPIITRPIFSPNPRPDGPGVIGQTGEAVAVPGVLRGFQTVQADSFLWGADANLRNCIFTRCDSRAAWFAGYRYLNLRESVTINEFITVTGNANGRVLIPDPVGTVVVVTDRFATSNHFNGGQIGGMYERRWGRVSVDGRASVAFGVTHQELSIFGIQTRTRPGQPPESFRGGLLAAGPNLGNFTRDEFSVVPEVTLNVGYWVTPNFKAFVGYNFLYWPNVIRPGEQIDSVVDLTFVPNAPQVLPSGQNRPAPLFRQSDLWVTGIQFGVEWRW